MFAYSTNMQISFPKNNIYFTSTPIRQVNLKKITNGIDDGFIKAIFSNLNPANPKDRKAVKYINKTWNKNLITNEFCDEFLARRDFDTETFYCIELPNKKKLGDKIIGVSKGILFSDNNKPEYFLHFIAINPSLRATSENRQIKNIGEVMLGEAFNLAKTADASHISFENINSFCNKVFKKAGIKIFDSNQDSSSTNAFSYFFSINKDIIDKYLNYYQKEFQII